MTGIIALSELRSKWLPRGTARLFLAVLFAVCLCVLCSPLLRSQASAPGKRPSKPAPAAANIQPAAPPIQLARKYQDGEKIAYKITCIDETPAKTTGYEARAEGVVEKNSSGLFEEDFAWTDLSVNDEQVHLSPASRAFRESLSLAQGAKLTVPDLRGVQSGLINPATDLLTFYADVKIAMNQAGLAHAGDHAYVNFGAPNSWADGTRIVLGQDAIDFDITLRSIDQTAGTATLLVHHVPPAQPKITLPAAWMGKPVGSSANNWVQIEKGADGKYTAGIGQETVTVEIKMALATGRILSATSDSRVDLLESVCGDAALTACGTPVKAKILRQISLVSEPAGP